MDDLLERVKKLEENYLKQVETNQKQSQEIEVLKRGLVDEKETTLKLRKAMILLRRELESLKEEVKVVGGSDSWWGGNNNNNNSQSFSTTETGWGNQQMNSGGGTAPVNNNVGGGFQNQRLNSFPNDMTFQSENSDDVKWKQRLGGYFEAKFDRLGEFKNVIKVLNDLLSCTEFAIGRNGLAIQAMDSSHVSLIELNMRIGCFSSLTYTNTRGINFGIELNDIMKAVSNESDDDSFTMKIEEGCEDGLTCKVDRSDGTGSTFVFSLLEIESDDLAIPETEYSCVVKMSSAYFSKLVTEMSKNDSDTITFGCGGGFFSVSVIDEKGSKSGESVKEGSNFEGIVTTVNVIKPASLHFASKYLLYFCKAASFSKEVMICFSPEAPLRLEYILSDGYVRFYLAPKIDDDEFDF